MAAAAGVAAVAMAAWRTRQVHERRLGAGAVGESEHTAKLLGAREFTHSKRLADDLGCHWWRHDAFRPVGSVGSVEAVEVGRWLSDRSTTEQGEKRVVAREGALRALIGRWESRGVGSGE